MLHEDRRRAGSFGEDAEQYDRARPSYPAVLVDDLLSEGAHDVLDVGCGTGKVARLFLARGCDVLGVEPDERMAAVARRHGVVVEIATFEEWDSAQGAPSTSSSRDRRGTGCTPTAAPTRPLLCCDPAAASRSSGTVCNTGRT